MIFMSPKRLGVTGVVDRLAVLQPHDEAGRLTEVRKSSKLLLWRASVRVMRSPW